MISDVTIVSRHNLVMRPFVHFAYGNYRSEVILRAWLVSAAFHISVGAGQAGRFVVGFVGNFCQDERAGVLMLPG